MISVVRFFIKNILLNRVYILRRIRASILAFLIIVILLQANSCAQEGLNELLAQGERDLQHGDCQQAISKFEKASEVNVRSGAADSGLRKAYNCFGLQLLERDPSGALEQFLSAILLFKWDEDAYKNACLAMKRLNLDPDQDSDWIKVSEKYLQKYKYKAAYIAYEQAVCVNDKKRQSIHPFNPYEDRHNLSKGVGRPTWAIAKYFKRSAQSYYLLNMQHMIQEQWHPPKGFNDSQIYVEFTVDQNGNVSDVTTGWYYAKGEMSGRVPTILANAALVCVKKASPFGRLPNAFGKPTLKWGYTLTPEYPLYGTLPLP